MNAHSIPQAIAVDDPPARTIRGDRPGRFVSGVGAPVILLHSSLGSKAQWTALAERLATRFRVIALDLCGYGDNPMPTATTAFSLDDEMRLVTGHIDQLVEPHARVHVVGHSYGGLVALRLAQCWGARIASLSLYEPVAFRLLDDNDAALANVRRLVDLVTRLAPAGRRHEAARAFVDFWSGDGTYASLALPAQASIARRVAKVPLDFQAALRWPRCAKDLHIVETPTLLLAGMRSPAVARRIVKLLASSLPNRRTWWFDAGHMAPIENPNRINYWIETFLNACAEGHTAAAAQRTVEPQSRLTPAFSGAPRQ